jgi:hypothetical protein
MEDAAEALVAIAGFVVVSVPPTVPFEDLRGGGGFVEATPP